MSLRIPGLLLTALTLGAALGGTADARTAADFFGAAPDSVYPILTGSTRLDMIDYYNYGSDRSSDNRLGGHSRITAQTDRTLGYELSERSSGQLAVLVPAPGDTVIAVVTTVPTPLPDSEIAFYTTDWRAAAAPVALPAYSDWLSDEGRRRADRAAGLVPFVTAQATFSPAADTLTLVSGVGSYLAPADRDEGAALFLPQLTRTVTPAKPSRR